ncbi:hypothetical protein IAU60_005033 [Kwoniella sp. DSM 27419]
MQLGRYSVSTLRPAPIHAISFSENGELFTVAGEAGYEVWRTWPLALLQRKVLPGTLALALLLPGSPLLVLQGGGAAPLYSPNKAVIYHDKLGQAIAEIEFGERIRGVAARKGLICIALSRKVIAFEYGVGGSNVGDRGTRDPKGKQKETSKTGGFWMVKMGEWETTQNEQGLMALSTAPGSSLLALPGRQSGHVQLITLPPCPPVPSTSTPSSTAFRSPIILAHTHALSTLAATPSGSQIMTSSERGTLVRIWDTTRGRLEKELRRGVDRAEMWGARFDPLGDVGPLGFEGRVVGWSDKGTVHVWGDGEAAGTPAPYTPTLTSILSRNLPLPKYFSSTASFAQYHLPRKNPHAISTALGAAGVNVPTMKNDDEGEESERFVVGWVNVQLPKGSDPDRTVTSGSSRDTRSDAAQRVNRAAAGSPGGHPHMGIGPGMGTRDERRSFGSDGTSRTATPPLRGGTPTPTSTGLGRRTGFTGAGAGPAGGTVHRSTSGGFVNKSSVGSEPSASVKGKAGASSRTHRHPPVSATGPQGSTAPSRASGPGLSLSPRSGTKTERQLVAITYSGDWYRLRIPRRERGELSGTGEAGAEEAEWSKDGKCELVEYRRLGVGGGGW